MKRLSKLIWPLVILWGVVALFCVYSDAMAADVTLGWDANTESDLAGYRVYYGTAPGTYLQAKGSGIDVPLAADEDPASDKVAYTVKGLTKGPTYYFAVTAYDNEVPSQESGYSNEVKTNFSPSAPGGVRVKVTVEVNVP